MALIAAGILAALAGHAIGQSDAWTVRFECQIVNAGETPLHGASCRIPVPASCGFDVLALECPEDLRVLLEGSEEEWLVWSFGDLLPGEARRIAWTALLKPRVWWIGPGLAAEDSAHLTWDLGPATSEVESILTRCRALRTGGDEGSEWTRLVREACGPQASRVRMQWVRAFVESRSRRAHEQVMRFGLARGYRPALQDLARRSVGRHPGHPLMVQLDQMTGVGIREPLLRVVRNGDLSAFQRWWAENRDRIHHDRYTGRFVIRSE